MLTRRITTVSRGFSSKILRASAQQPLLDSKLVNMPFGRFLMEDFTKPELKDVVAITDGTTGAELKFPEVHSHAYNFAQTMRKDYNIGKNDCVAVFSPNHINYHTVFQGIALTGAFSQCINPLYTEEEAMYQVEITNAKVMIAHPFCMKIATAVAAKKGIPVINIAGPNAAPGLEALPSVESMVAHTNIRDIDQESYGITSGEDLLTVPFSSGTTGRPKGVMLTHRNVIANLLQCMPPEGDYLRTGADGVRQKLLCPLPFFHIYGLIAGLFLPIYVGAQSIFMPAFDMVKFLEIIQQYKVTRAHVVPPICLGLAKHPIVDKFDLSSVKVLMSGAAPLGAEVQMACGTRLNCLVKQAWGMTELSPAGTIFPDDLLREMKGNGKGSSGPLVPGTEAKIVCLKTGQDLLPTEEGELCIRGPQVMKGYYKNKEATDNMIDKDGWLHTGDIATFDEQGLVYLLDRCKELIKYKGFQVAPAELEAVILQMPEITDVVVIPVPDEEGGEVPRAYVVKKPDAAVTDQQVVDFVAAKVAPSKKLRGGVRFTDVVPKSASGKILRRIQIQKDREMDAAANN